MDIGDWSNGMIGVSKTFGGGSIPSSPAQLVVENLEKSRLSPFLVASRPGFEPGAFRLGVAPIRHRQVTPDTKKCLEIQAFSVFPIPSDTML